MRIRLQQIWKHALVIFLPVAFIVGGLITAMPINLERPYELQLAERFITPFVLLGFLAIPAQAYYDFIGLIISPSGRSLNTPRPDYIALLPETGFPWVAVALLIVSGVLFGVLLWKLQTGLLARKSIRILLLINWALPLTFYVLSGAWAFGTVYYSLKAECSIFITEDKTITVRYFNSMRPEEVGLAGIPPLSASVYKISDGDTGRDFMFIPHHMGHCNQNGRLNNNTFWLWEWDTLIITHDGGQTWDLWKLKALGGAFADPASTVADSYIESVTFSDALHGEMTAAYFRHTTQDRPQFSLYTTDGGQTWQLTEDFEPEGRITP